MGHKDLMSLYPIVQECRRLEGQYNWGYQFKWDQGDYETVITINSDGSWESIGHKVGTVHYNKIYVPDIIDFHNKIIIEFEEEAKPNTGYLGAKKHKGHFQELPTSRDEERDSWYELAKFDVLKIYESQKDWKERLKNFLLNHFIKTNVEANQFYKALKKIGENQRSS